MSQKSKNIKKEQKSSKNNSEISSNEALINNNKMPVIHLLGNKNNEENSSKNIKKNKNKKNLEQSKINDYENKGKTKEEKKKNIFIKTKIIDEVPKDQILQNKIKNVFHKIVFVFHNKDYFLKVKPELKIKDMINKIKQHLNAENETLSLKYKDNEISEKYNDFTVKQFFNFPQNKSRPIIYVKIKRIINNYSNDNLSSEIDKYSIFYKRNYDNKIKISNYPVITDINLGLNEDIYNIINTFLKENNILSDFTCERKEEKENNKKNNNNNEIKVVVPMENNDLENNNDIQILNNNDNNNSNDNNLQENKSEDIINNTISYIIGFPSPDIAFDFNRYLNALRLMNPVLSNIKIQVLLSKKKSQKKKKNYDDINDNFKKNYQFNYNYRYGTSLNYDEPDLDKRNIEILSVIRNNFLNNKMNSLMRGNNSCGYLNISSPYSTPYDESIKDKHENRKKWLNPKGFISCVNKNSGYPYRY